MPRRLICDAHEWINEIPTVPINISTNTQTRERACNNQRGKKTLLSLTLVRLCKMTYEVQPKWENFAAEKPLLVLSFCLFRKEVTGQPVLRTKCKSNLVRALRKTWSGGEFGWGGTSVKK